MNDSFKCYQYMSFTIWLGQHEYFPQDIRSTMPELNKLLQEATQADVLLDESVDRLSSLTQHDFNKLKKRIQEKELHYWYRANVRRSSVFRKTKLPS